MFVKNTIEKKVKNNYRKERNHVPAYDHSIQYQENSDSVFKQTNKKNH